MSTAKPALRHCPPLPPISARWADQSRIPPNSGAALEFRLPSARIFRNDILESPKYGQEKSVDLRPFNLSQTMVQKAANVLNYQPFVISSELQTGVAYSILHSFDARVHAPLVFHRNEWSVEDWNKITSPN